MTDFTQIISMEEQNMIFEKLKDIIAEQLSVDADKVTLEANIQEDSRR